jgi:hypothetical protein
LFPALWLGLLRMLDVRTWPRSVWLFINVAVILALVWMKVGPGLVSDWRERRARLSIERQRQAKQREEKAQRELLERLREARKRQVY